MGVTQDLGGGNKEGVENGKKAKKSIRVSRLVRGPKGETKGNPKWFSFLGRLVVVHGFRGVKREKLGTRKPNLIVRDE